SESIYPRVGTPTEYSLASCCFLDSAYQDAGVAYSLFLIEIGKLFLQLAQFRQVVENDIRIMRVPFEEILMVPLSRIEGLERNDLGHNRSSEGLGFVQLIDIGQCRLFLILIRIEDHR